MTRRVGTTERVTALTLKRTLTLLLGLVISGGALYYLIGKDIETLRGELADARYEYLALVIPVYVLALVPRGFRWRALIGYRASTWHTFHIMNVGYLLSGIIPRLGEPARAWLMTRLTPPVKFFTALSSIVVERVLDLLSVIVMLGISLLVLDVPDEVSGAGAFLGVVSIGMVIVMGYFALNRDKAHRILGFFVNRISFLGRFKLVDWLDHFLDGLSPLVNKRTALDVMFWNLISWLLSLAAGYLLMLVFFEEGDLPGVTLMIVMLALAVAIPSVPGNLGPFEAAVVAGFWVAGVIESTDAPQNAPAVAYGLTLHALTLGIYVILGMLGLAVEQTSLGQVREAAQHEQAKEAV